MRCKNERSLELKMQKKVLILLNERENQKKEAADRLEQELATEGITVSRTIPSPKVDKEIEALKPAVIVVDFILEDFGTGLDLLEKYVSAPSSSFRPKIVFYTDDPSLEVALAAMRLGATDYHILTQQQSLFDCVRSIKSVLSSEFQSDLFKKKQDLTPTLENLVLSSEPAKQAAEQIQLELDKQSKVIVLLGPKGSGKTTLIKACLRSQKLAPYVIDFRYQNESISEIFDRHSRQMSDRVVGVSPLHLILQDVETHSSSIIHFIKEEFGALTTTLLSFAPIPLFITTSDIQVARACSDLLGAATIELPGLTEKRAEDIGPLVQHFLFQAQKIKNEASKIKLTAKELSWFQEQEWPGNIPQLKEVVLGFALGGGHIEAKDSIEKLTKLHDYSKITLPGPENPLNDPIEILSTLNRCKGDLIHTAAHLGCNVRDLIAATQSAKRLEGGAE